MPRSYKCYWCEGKDYDENMVIVQQGKQNKRYHKLNCYDEYLKDQEFKQQESKELDELVEVIKETHSINIVPPQFFSFLQDIRNGNQLFGRVGQKKSKSGYTYKVIARTYEECQDSINWARNNRNFNGSLAFLKYTRAIILDKIDQVSEQVASERKQLEEQKRQRDIIKDYAEDDWTFNNENNNNDISDLLD